MKLLGYKRSDFNTKDGKRITGINVYLSEEIDPKLGAGISVERVYLTDDKINRNNISIKALLSKDVKVFFNRFGKIEDLISAE